MVIRFVIKAAVVTVLCLAAASYIVYLKTGRFWVPSFDNIDTTQISMPEVLQNNKTVMQSVSAPTEPTYKWRQGGQWHYGEKPPKGIKAIKINE